MLGLFRLDRNSSFDRLRRFKFVETDKLGIEGTYGRCRVGRVPVN
jgi:hypothetical protein